MGVNGKQPPHFWLVENSIPVNEPCVECGEAEKKQSSYPGPVKIFGIGAVRISAEAARFNGESGILCLTESVHNDSEHISLPQAKAMPDGRAKGTPADGMSGFNGVYFLLNDRQEAQGQKDGEGKTIGHADMHEPCHEFTNICRPDKNKGCQYHDRDAQKELQSPIKTLLTYSDTSYPKKAGGWSCEEIDYE